MSASIASMAARLTKSGAGKSGKPWARLIAPCSSASRVISRITDSEKTSVRAATKGRGAMPAILVHARPPLTLVWLGSYEAGSLKSTIGISRSVFVS